MSIPTKVEKVSDYIIVFLLIACSGIPFFIGSYYLMPLSLLYAVLLTFFRKKTIVDYKLILIVVILFIFTVLREQVNDSSFSIYITLVILLKFTFPFFVLKLTGIRFLHYYKNVLFYLSIISLFFFVLFTFSPGLESYFKANIAPFFAMKSKNDFYTYGANFILYTMKSSGRNDGPFWEAGGFGVFLIIALIFQLLQRRSIFDKYGLVFIIAIITTYSTSTYIALAIIVLAYILMIPEVKYRLLLIPVIVMLGINFYTETPFLANKIENQYETINENYDARVANRFTSVLIDWEKIVSHPVFGNPQNEKKEFDIYSHRNNGISSMAVEYGFVFTFIFFLLVFLSFKRLMIYFKNYKLTVLGLIFGAILIIYFGQVLTNKPMLNALALLPLALNINSNPNSLNLRKRNNFKKSE